MILRKIFGVNFCNYNFIKHIFKKVFLKENNISIEDCQIPINFKKYDLEIQDQKILMVFYRGNLDSTLIFDVSFDKRKEI